MLITINGFSQNKEIADSLLSVLKVDWKLTDVEKIGVLNRIAFNQTNPDSGLFYSNELIEFSSAINNINGLQQGYFQRGNSLRLKGDYDEAIESYFQAVEFALEADRTLAIGSNYNAIGDVYSIIGNHQNSIDYYAKGILILKENLAVKNDTIALASGLMNLGDEYLNVEELDSALKYFSASGELFEEVNYEIGKAYNLGNIGLVYALLDDDDLAEKNILEASNILERLGDRYPIAVYNTYMADIYAEKGEFNIALNYAKESLKIGEEEGLKEQIRDASMKLAELYEAQDDLRSAFQFQKKYIQLRDSINNEMVIQEIADIRREFEVSQKQAEVDLLTAERRTQRVIGFSLMGGLALVLALAIIQYRNNRQKQKINRILRDQKAKLEELNQTKDRFFSIISHDLRGPVNAFHGVSRMIKFFVQQKQMGQLEELAEDIDQSVDRLSSLLDNLLNWAVQQQGNFPYVPEKLNINFMADDLVKTFTTMASSKQINLASEVDPDTDAWADRNTTMTIIRNLVSNALKFTPQNGQVKIKAGYDDESILLQVIDNGVGIPAEKLNDLFKLQAKKSTWGTDGEKGLGLGLQLVYDFVTLNKGKIDVESTPDQGTTFSVWLPIFEEVVVPENV